MTEYVTTNVRLPKDLYRQAKRRALEEEKSLAQVIRESVVQYLTGTSSSALSNEECQKIPWEVDPVWLIGTDGTSADVTDLSAKKEEYLYGPLSETARAEIKD